jgi:hypothetical protein
MYKGDNEYRPNTITNVSRKLFTYKEILLRTPILTLYNTLPHSVMYLFSIKQLYLHMTTQKTCTENNYERRMAITERVQTFVTWITDVGT